jgi:hypothetical protein
MRRFGVAVVVCLVLSGCNTLTPEIRLVPQSQSAVLDVVIERVEADAVPKEEILEILRADRDAWNELDRFFRTQE